MNDEEFKAIDLGEMFGRDRQHQSLIKGKWLSVNLDGSDPE